MRLPQKPSQQRRFSGGVAWSKTRPNLITVSPLVYYTLGELGAINQA